MSESPGKHQGPLMAQQHMPMLSRPVHQQHAPPQHQNLQQRQPQQQTQAQAQVQVQPPAAGMKTPNERKRKRKDTSVSSGKEGSAERKSTAKKINQYFKSKAQPQSSECDQQGQVQVQVGNDELGHAQRQRISPPKRADHLQHHLPPLVTNHMHGVHQGHRAPSPTKPPANSGAQPMQLVSQQVFHIC